MIGLLLLIVAAPLYLAAAWLFGLWPHDAVGTIYYAGGAILAMVTAAAVMVMGESVIEDGVKFALFAALTGGLWSFADPAVLAIALGAPVGASLSLIARMLPGSGGVGGGSPSNSYRAKGIDHCEMIPVGLDDVWRLFTEREQITQWWHEDASLELREGGHFSAPWRVRKGRMRQVEGRVIAFRAPGGGGQDDSERTPGKLVLEWQDPRWPEDLEVTLRFRDDDGDTMLEVRQLGFEALKAKVSAQTIRYYTRQWQVLLMNFNAYAVRMTKIRS